MTLQMLLLLAMTPFMALLTWNSHRTGKMLVSYRVVRRAGEPKLFRAYMIARFVVIGMCIAVPLAAWAFIAHSISN